MTQAKYFNPEWYLATYPDAAAAGVAPWQHFLTCGRREGRLPCFSDATVLEAQLWEGFSNHALPALLRLHAETGNVCERNYVGWVLARWFASCGEWERALAFDNDLAETALALPRVLLRVDILLRLGQTAAARDSLTAALAHWGPTLPDLCLVSANLLGREQQEESANSVTDTDELRLAQLNSVFALAGLAPIREADPAERLNLDNLSPAFPEMPSTVSGPLISVIMPARNAESFIATALRGLLAQTWSNFEVLVVDDASTDNTAAVVTHLAETDSRIRLLSLPKPAGAYVARNFALRHLGANSVFVTNHDSDDWSHPQRLEHLASVLMSRPELKGVMAHWVRADSGLHFQRWRMENSLIHPTVSTLMYRREVFEVLGGWDEVKVGADTELWQRALVLFGPDAVCDVLPGIPMAIARQLPDSLTSAAATHLRTQFWGLRRLYHELSRRWHVLANRPQGLWLGPAMGERRFPVPPGMLQQAPPRPDFDVLLMADLGATSGQYAEVHDLVAGWVAQYRKIALFHWPDCRDRPPSAIADCFLDMAVQDELSIVLGGDVLEARTVILLGLSRTKLPPNKLPLVRSQDFRCFDLERATTRLADLPTPDVPEDLLQRLRDSEWFDSAWYLRRYPDVAMAGMDPGRHYLIYGAREGREPGPKFQPMAYDLHCGSIREKSHFPALAHFLNAGQRLGYETRTLQHKGKVDLILNTPTVLLCAHEAESTIAGAERSFIDLLEMYRALGFNILVSVPRIENTDYINHIKEFSCFVFHIPSQFWSMRHEASEKTVAQFCRIIEDFKATLIHVNTIVLREPLLAGRQSGVTTIVHVRESLEGDQAMCDLIGGTPSEIRANLLSHADYFIANSRYTAQKLGIKDRTFLVPNTLKTELFNIPNPIDPNRIRIALISSNLPKKGVDDFFQLAEIMRDKAPNARFLLIGRKTENIKQIQQQTCLSKNIEILGYIPDSIDAVKKANIIINLSHFPETFGRTILEGMAAGRAVISYQQGAIPELIIDGTNGYLIPQGDINLISERICELCQKPELIKELGQQGRKIAETNWNRTTGIDALRYCLSQINKSNQNDNQ